ncbi:MAG: O-antigen ligase family protein [Cetobacterium sp.]|nr:O-antigen ligase family protein [Cetobacterium sp.]
MKSLKKKISIEKITYLLGVLFLYFFSRRGGDTRYYFQGSLMVIGLYYMYKNRWEDIKNNKFLYGITGIYTLLLGLVFLLSDNRSENLKIYLGMTLFSGIFFLVGKNIEVEKKYYKYIISLFMIFSLGSVYRGVEDIIKHKKILSYYRIAGGTFTTVYAMEIGIYILLGIFGIILFKKIYFKFLSGIYVVINIILLICTKSRNTMVAIPLTLLIIYFIWNRKRGSIILLLGLILGIGIIKNSGKIPHLQRLQTLSSVENIKKNARYEIYITGLKMGKEKPLLGQGFYKYEHEGYETRKNGTKYQHFHNMFMETYVTEGILVLISYILFIGGLLYKSLNCLKKLDVENKKIMLLGLSVLIFGILYGQFESIIYFTKPYIMLFILLTICFIITDEKIKK